MKEETKRKTIKEEKAGEQHAPGKTDTKRGKG